MRPTTEQIQQEALSRAVSGRTLSNWLAIIAGFTAKGIPEQDIRPRENVSLMVTQLSSLGQLLPCRPQCRAGPGSVADRKAATDQIPIGVLV
jgi:hypothetical protein